MENEAVEMAAKQESYARVRYGWMLKVYVHIHVFYSAGWNNNKKKSMTHTHSLGKFLFSCDSILWWCHHLDAVTLSIFPPLNFLNMLAHRLKIQLWHSRQISHSISFHASASFRRILVESGENSHTAWELKPLSLAAAQFEVSPFCFNLFRNSFSATAVSRNILELSNAVTPNPKLITEERRRKSVFIPLLLWIGAKR